MDGLQFVRAHARLAGFVLAVVGVGACAVAAPNAIAAALAGVSVADRGWLVLAAVCFLTAALASCAAWRSTFGACGARLGRRDVVARYAVGCLVNSFTPARAGEAVRIALLGRAVGRRGGIFTAAGVCAALGVLRAAVMLGLLVGAAAAGVVPPVALLPLAGVVVVAAATFLVARRHLTSGRVGRALEAFRSLARSPAALVSAFGWVAFSVAARVAAAAASAAALGIPHPIVAALLIVPALEVAGALPVTPGNVGVTSATIALVLRTQGVPVAPALAAGIAFHAVEMVVGISFGLAGAANLAPAPPPRVRRWIAGGVAVGAAVSASALLGVWMGGAF